MRIPRIQTLLGVLAIMTLVTTSVDAQNYGQRQYSGPFVDFDEFNPDYQFFAPLDNTHFGDFTPNLGWFFTWDKLFTKSARPRQEESYGGFDRGSGTRISLGFMRPDSNGWSLSTTRIGGPNLYQELVVERNNRVAEEDDGGGGGGGGGGGDDEQTPSQDDNNPITGQRDYILRDSINAISYSSWELNRTWRLKENDKGRIWEPMLGIRYSNMQDQFEEAEYNRYDEDGLPVPQIPNPNDPNSPSPDDAEIEEFILEQGTHTNDMFGGQLGLRWYHKQSRWLLSNELRFFAMNNSQSIRKREFREVTLVEVGAGEEPESQTRVENVTWENNNSFVWGGEYRHEAAYEITRDVTARFGFNVLNYGKGIGRGDNYGDRFLTYGFNFGITLNR